MVDIILILAILLTLVILLLLYFVENVNKKNGPMSLLIKKIRKGVVFILECLSNFL